MAGNPWIKTNNPYQQSGNLGPLAAFKTATQPVAKDMAAVQRAPTDEKPTKVELPYHLYIPNDAQGIDIRRLCVIKAGTQEDLLHFQAPASGIVRFINYGVFSDGEFSTDQEFVPKVNGVRVLPFHGDPDNNYKINLGLAPDLSNNSLIQCQLALKPNDILYWTLINNSTFDVPMGVRMVGYLDNTMLRSNERFGG